MMTPRFFSFLFKLVDSWRECSQIFKEFQPSVVLGMGGFTSAIPLFFALRRGIATLIHESNAIPGRVTRLIAPRVNKTLLGFASCASYLCDARCVITGTPVRKRLERLDRTRAAEKMGLDPHRKILMIMGGSQGAHGLNEIVLKMLPLLGSEEREQWQFIHLSGQTDARLVEINYRRYRLTSIVEAFTNEMEIFYSMADLIITRSGAASLTEISSYGLPSILIPFPAAADDHQTFNARVFEEAGAARLFQEKTVSSQNLYEEIKSLFAHPEQLNAMSRAAQALAGGEAAMRVAEEIETCRPL
jgi:UDP-N-acetylglucosamine--N-acetylmuramyl-(pentapeptide) pyrophosphoryl-undecaprenol N-acetylglucosamine transferase